MLRISAREQVRRWVNVDIVIVDLDREPCF
jgi:hypothetical protein